MEKGNKITFIIIGLAICAFILCVGMVLINDYIVKKLYITHGYEQVMVKGSASYLWQKKK